MWNRRQLLKAGLAGAGLAGLDTHARAASVSGQDLKFIFVFVYGGWDVTKVFVPAFDNPLVDMEAEATQSTLGGISFVDHAERPSVRSFFERWHQQSCIINGISVPSVGHIECLRILYTGDGTGTSADWPSLLAAGSDRYALPCVVVQGPQFPGSLGSLVTRVGTSGYTAALLNGDLLDFASQPALLPSSGVQDLLDQFAADQAKRRAQTARGGRQPLLLERHQIALERAITLEKLQNQLRWPADSTLSHQLDFAIDLLKLGVSRSVVVEPFELRDWDTHANNDTSQSYLFEQLFQTLLSLMDNLQATPGTVGATLADETVVVVMSEMGRTPQWNAGLGKDHWGNTSTLLCGPRIVGDRVIGGFGEYFYGSPIDFASGTLSETGKVIAGGDLGATLLTLADMDLPQQLQNHSPITAILS